MPEPTNTLDKMIDEIILADCPLLMGGLTVLAKDLSEFLTVHAYYGPDTQRFTEPYATTLQANRFLWASLPAAANGNGEAPRGLLYTPLQETGMPHGFAERAFYTDFSMAPLLDGAVNQEWTRHPGWALLLAFRNAFSDTLCKPGGVIKLYLDAGANDKKKLAGQIAAVLIKEKFSQAPYWRPFAAQLGALIAKADVEAYYEANRQGKEG